MECSWDKGELAREKKLTNISKWKELNESDLQQYIASSDSEEEEEEEEEEEDEEDDGLKKKKAVPKYVTDDE